MFLYWSALKEERKRERERDLQRGRIKIKKERGSSHFLEKCPYEPVIRERNKKREGNVFNV